MTVRLIYSIYFILTCNVKTFSFCFSFHQKTTNEAGGFIAETVATAKTEQEKEKKAAAFRSMSTMLLKSVIDSYQNREEPTKDYQNKEKQPQSREQPTVKRQHGNIIDTPGRNFTAVL